MDYPDYTTEHQKGKHLTYEEYVKIQVRLQDGWTANRIAVKELHCSPNTVRKIIRQGMTPLYHGKVQHGEDELRRIMAEPLEKWRVFLHPTQRKIVQKEYSGSAKVLGGAGTGKTVVAMHRAKHLASKCEGQQRILMTTFTANLAADIRENLRKICTLEELRRIEVIHLDAWVNQFLRESGFSAQIGYDDVINPLWERAVLLANIDLPYETTFYEEEWNRIVIAQEALTLEKYVKVTRNGRGTRLDRKKRMQVWKVFENWRIVK